MMSLRMRVRLARRFSNRRRSLVVRLARRFSNRRRSLVERLYPLVPFEKGHDLGGTYVRYSTRDIASYIYTILVHGTPLGLLAVGSIVVHRQNTCIGQDASNK